MTEKGNSKTNCKPGRIRPMIEGASLFMSVEWIQIIGHENRPDKSTTSDYKNSPAKSTHNKCNLQNVTSAENTLKSAGHKQSLQDKYQWETQLYKLSVNRTAEYFCISLDYREFLSYYCGTPPHTHTNTHTKNCIFSEDFPREGNAVYTLKQMRETILEFSLISTLDNVWV